MHKFEYSYVQAAQCSIEIDDTAQCCLELVDVLHYHYYLLIQTIMGRTKIYQFGPIMPDEEKLPYKVKGEYQEIDCNIPKINSIIEKFIDSHSAIPDGVSLITVNEAKQHIINPVDVFVEEQDND